MRLFFFSSPASPFTPAPLCLSNASDPFLHGAFAVQYVARRALLLELHHGVDNHHPAQREHARDDDDDGLHCVRPVFQLDHHVRVAVVGRWTAGVDRPEIAAHEVFEDGARVARLHPQELVVELPVFLPLVEVGKTYKKRTANIKKLLTVSIFVGKATTQLQV